jgi:hypothetical protein
MTTPTTIIHDSNDPAHANCEACRTFAPIDSGMRPVSFWYCGIYSGPYQVNVTVDHDSSIARTSDNWPYRCDELFLTEKAAIQHARTRVIAEENCLHKRLDELDARFDAIEDAETNDDDEYEPSCIPCSLCGKSATWDSTYGDPCFRCIRADNE